MNGDGEQTRDFTYIENAVQANVRGLFAPKKAVNEVFNIAFGERISLNSLWSSLQKTSGKSLGVNFGPDRPGDVRDSLANIDKARSLIGYDPLFSVEDGLKITWEKFKH
jgi:UDP-N-acetylglucosamine 4-epimerase